MAYRSHARIVVMLAAILVAGVLALRNRPTAAKSPVNAPPPAAEEIRPRAVEQDGLTVLLGTPFDVRYGSASSSAQEDLTLLREIIGAAFTLVKNFRELPLADNADFVNFLSGNNSHRVAWLRPGHPALNANGELLDRWGEPVFFHRESSSRTSLRSAGPDRRLWTEDDVVLDDLTDGIPR